MNIVTHGLASLALARAAWPRAPKEMWIAAMAIGVIADVDSASAWFGAASWLNWHRTYTHSLLTAILIAAGFAAGYRVMAGISVRQRFSVAAAFVLALSAGWLHLLMDVCGWEGVALLWPFSARRFAMDWVAELDPIVIAVLLGALLFPELLHLVSSEIGVRDKGTRGRIGACIGFATVILYLAMRANFHGNVIALMEARAFRGEVAKRTGAFPEALSPLAWHGIVDTERGLYLVTAMEGPASSFDPESAETLFKPAPSPALDAAEKTAAAETFLRVARFPKASVEATPAGTRVELRDLRYRAVGETIREVVAVIQLDAANRIVSQGLFWSTALAQE